MDDENPASAENPPEKAVLYDPEKEDEEAGQGQDRSLGARHWREPVLALIIVLVVILAVWVARR